MAYKRRFGNYEEESDYGRRKKRNSDEINSITETTDEESRGMPPRPTAQQVAAYGRKTVKDSQIPVVMHGAKHDPTNPNTPAYWKEPDLYQGGGRKGKINPDYDTTIGQDMLGGAYAAIQHQNGNPFHDLGLALGGLGGGALNKNLRGKQKHAQDVQNVRQHNRQVDLRTQAEIRIQSEQRMREREQRLAGSAAMRDEQRQGRYEAWQKKQDVDTAGQNLETAYMSGDEEETKKWATQTATLRGLSPDTDPEALIGWGKPTKVGNSMYQFSKEGAVKAAVDPETGRPLTSFTPQDWLKLVKASGGGKEEFSEPAAKQAYSKAVAFVDNLEKEKMVNFTTASGKRNNVQRNAYIKSTAEQMYEQGMEVPDTITIGSETFSYSSEKGLQTQPTQEDPNKVHDATQPAENPPLASPTDAGVPNHDPNYPLKMTDTANKKTYKAREVEPPSALAGKKYPEGTQFKKKDGKGILLFKGGSWYEVIE